MQTLWKFIIVSAGCKIKSIFLVVVVRGGFVCVHVHVLRGRREASRSWAYDSKDWQISSMVFENSMKITWSV